MDTIATVEPLTNPNKPPGEVELSKALSCLGYGSWTGLEPKTERENFNYVPKKLNKALFTKLQKLEEKKEAEYRARKQAEKESEPKRKGSKKKKSKKSNEEIEKAKIRQTNFVEQERAIHEAYQLILNEYYRKVRGRKKAIESGAMLFGKLKNDPSKLEKMIAGNSALAEEEQPEEDEFDKFNINDAKSLIQKMETGELSSKNKDESNTEGNPQFRNKVKKMQTNKALGKLLCNVGEERFNRIKKEKMEEHMGYNKASLDV